MHIDLNGQNKNYWQTYKPGEIPTIPKNPPDSLISKISGPILDVGVGDGLLAEELVTKGVSHSWKWWLRLGNGNRGGNMNYSVDV